MRNPPPNCPEDVERAVEAALAMSGLEDDEGSPDEREPEVELAAEWRADAAERAPATTRSLSGNRTHQPDREATEARARELAGRYRLSPDLAQGVAEGRLRLASAIALHRARSSSANAGRGVPASMRIAGFLLLAGVAALGFVVRRTWTEHVRVADDVSAAAAAAPEIAVAGPDEPRVSPLVRVEQNAAGEVARVSGLQPREVVHGFCRATGACAPGVEVAIAPPVPPQPTVRIGWFRAAADPDRWQALEIRRDPRSRRWVAGDGEQIVVLEPASLAAPAPTARPHGG